MGFWKLKWVVITALMAFSCNGLSQSAGRGGGSGDMPFPIGRMTEFPAAQVKGIWAAENLKTKLFKLTPIPKIPNKVGVEMLNVFKEIVAQGIGEIGDDKILRANLLFRAGRGHGIDVQIANLCMDDEYENRSNKLLCDRSAMVVSTQESTATDRNKALKYYYILKKQ